MREVETPPARKRTLVEVNRGVLKKLEQMEAAATRAHVRLRWPKAHPAWLSHPAHPVRSKERLKDLVRAAVAGRVV